MKVESLTVYPLKAAKGHSLSAVEVTSEGLKNDRRWVLVDQEGHFVSQRTLPQLCQLQVSLIDGLLLHAFGETLRLDAPSTDARTVHIWNDEVLAQDWGPKVREFTQLHFGQELSLCEVRQDAPRLVNPKYTEAQEVKYAFADGFPFLVTTTESVTQLNQKLRAQGFGGVTMDRFRPNIVIAGWEAHGEDQAKRILIGDSIELVLAKPCARCSVINVEQTDAHVSQEPLRTLATYRKGPGGKVNFGQNAYLLRGAGSIIKVGDPVSILEHH